MINSFFSGFSVRWRVICDCTADPEKRVFTALELFCRPVSLVTLFALLPGQAIATRYGVAVPAWWTAKAMPVLVSAAVAYLTNWLAIEMLFKPYTPNRTHLLSLLTFGYWRLGLVPKNKDKIGKQAGQQIQANLLDPEKISNELCDMVVGLIQDKAVVANIRARVQHLVQTHEARVVAFLIPHIEKSLMDAVNRLVTPDTMRAFWDREIEPRLASEETRTLIAQNVIDALKRRSPQLMAEIKESVHAVALDYFSKKLPALLSSWAEGLAGGLVEFVDWTLVENKICDRLSSAETLDKIRDESLLMVERMRTWMASPESAGKMNQIVSDIKGRLEAFLRAYLHETLPQLASGFLASESLWAWVENELLPSARTQIEQLIKETGRDKIIERLNIAGRIEQAIREQDVHTFHDMINTVAAQHLGAIQVLGYILGAAVGAVQLLLG